MPRAVWGKAPPECPKCGKEVYAQATGFAPYYPHYRCYDTLTCDGTVEYPLQSETTETEYINYCFKIQLEIVADYTRAKLDWSRQIYSMWMRDLLELGAPIHIHALTKEQVEKVFKGTMRLYTAWAVEQMERYDGVGIGTLQSRLNAILTRSKRHWENDKCWMVWQKHPELDFDAAYKLYKEYRSMQFGAAYGRGYGHEPAGNNYDYNEVFDGGGTVRRAADRVAVNTPAPPAPLDPTPAAIHDEFIYPHADMDAWQAEYLRILQSYQRPIPTVVSTPHDTPSPFFGGTFVRRDRAMEGMIREMDAEAVASISSRVTPSQQTLLASKHLGLIHPLIDYRDVRPMGNPVSRWAKSRTGISAAVNAAASAELRRIDEQSLGLVVANMAAIDRVDFR